MNELAESKEEQEAVSAKPWWQRELVVFIVGSLFVSLALVVVSMALYESSGAAQLDLSRPGFQSVQSKVNETDTFQSFSASGSVDRKTLDQFQDLYKKQVKPVTGQDAFSGAALDDQALGIDEAADAPVTNN